MRYNELFDPQALHVMAVAKRGAISKSKPAITSYMVAKVIIINDEDVSRRVFGEMQLDAIEFHRMANDRINNMPTVSNPSPYVDEELDGVVRETVSYDGGGNAIAGSVTTQFFNIIVMSSMNTFSVSMLPLAELNLEIFSSVTPQTGLIWPQGEGCLL